MVHGTKPSTREEEIGRCLEFGGQLTCLVSSKPVSNSISKEADTGGFLWPPHTERVHTHPHTHT